MQLSNKKITTIKLLENCGTAKIGDVFVRGLYDLPGYHKNKNITKDQLFWKRGTERLDYEYIFDYWDLDFEIIN